MQVLLHLSLTLHKRRIVKISEGIYIFFSIMDIAYTPTLTCIGYGPAVTVTLGLTVLPGELLVKRGWHPIGPPIEAVVGFNANNDRYV